MVTKLLASTSRRSNDPKKNVLFLVNRPAQRPAELLLAVRGLVLCDRLPGRIERLEVALAVQRIIAAVEEHVA